MNAIPLNNHVLVELPKEDDVQQTKAGIWVTKNKNDEPRKGTVIAKADDVEIVDVGDTVFFREFAGEKVEEYIILPADDLLLKWKGGDASEAE